MEEAEQALIRVIGSKGLLAVLQAVKPASNKQVCSCQDQVHTASNRAFHCLWALTGLVCRPAW